MDFLQELNEKQLEAATATEGYVRIIAGAGSGKTKLLVSRYAYLVREYGIDPANILCVTFTNKAAGEMRKRILPLIGSNNEASLVCTYHGFCAKLLRENPEKLFLTKNFQIYDTNQQRGILQDVYQKFELKLDNASFEHILKKIGDFKADISYVPKMCSPMPCTICNDDKIVEEYMQRQKAVYALDFNDLISYALYLLKTDDEVRSKWQNRLNYIQVDEFQDSSCREMELIDILSNVYKNVMIVGDPDQNIYEWRGSDVKLLVDFDKHHQGTQTIFLNRNYRSTPQILACANSLIDKNELRLKKDLYTELPKGAEVIHFHSKNDEEEMNRLTSEIKRVKEEKGLSYSDFAVLYRSGFLSRLVEKKFVETNIPYEIYGGVKFYTRMEIQDIIAYLRLIAFEDDLSFKRIINTPRRKIGRTKVEYLDELQKNEATLLRAGTERPSLFSILDDHQSDSVFKSSGAGKFVEFIKDIRAKMHKMRISEIVNSVCSDSGYEQYIRELGDEERLDNLTEFKRIANEFEKNFGEDLTLEEFLQQIALQSNENEDKTGESVKMMTMHAAKGLEFPVVFVIGFTEKIFPSSKTIEERKKLGLEEERRLCYVAITRAKERLYLMDSEGLTAKGDKKLPSRFLFEIGEKNYHRMGKIADSLKNESFAFASKTDFSSQSTEMNVGDIVEHHIFGKGKIIAYDRKRESFTIKFDSLNSPRSISKSYFATKHERKPVLKAEEEKEQSKPSKSEPIAYIENKDRQSSLVEEKEEHALPVEEEGNPTTPIEKEGKPTAPIKKENKLIATVEKRSEPTAQRGEMPSAPTKKCSSANTSEKKNKPSSPSSSVGKSDNLWKRDDVPNSGWTCAGVTDLGEPSGICQMCGNQIRYVHHMTHPNHSPLNVGCVCAGKMEGNIDGAKRREQDFKNKKARQENFLHKPWKTSKNGNEYLKIKGHLFVLFFTSSGHWKYSLDGEFCNMLYFSKQEVLNAVCERAEQLEPIN